MPRKASDAVKSGIVRERQKNGDIYVYERKTKYDPNKRYNVTVSKKLVGKIPYGTTEIIETRPKKKSVPDNIDPTHSTPTATKQHVGMIDIIHHVSCKCGVQDEVLSALPNDRGMALKILTLAWYAFATDGETWPGVRSWSARYNGLLPYRDTPISEDMYHDVFVSLGSNENVRQSIFRHRAARMGDGELLALDSTTIETESSNLNVNRKGPNNEKVIKNIYKVVEIYSITARQPVAYARIPGNIADVSTVENALLQLRSLSIPNVEIVADCGYYSEENMLSMIKSRVPFIMHVPTDTKWIRPLVEQYRGYLQNGGEIIHCDPKFSGVTVAQMHDFAYTRQRASKASGLNKGVTEYVSRRIYIHIYFSSSKKAEEDVKFRKQYDAIRTDLLAGAKIEAKDLEFAEKYMILRKRNGKVTEVQVNVKEYQKHRRYHGFVVLVALKEKDTNTALEKYRAREYVEEDFKISKSHIGARCPRKWHDDTLEGQMLVQFLAQSMHESFESMIRDMTETLAVCTGDKEHDTSDRLNLEVQLKKWLRKTSLHEILMWFDAIESTSVTDGRKTVKWRTEETQRDKLFLEVLGIKPGK